MHELQTVKILFSFAWAENQAKAKKSSKFIFFHKNKRQGDLYSRVVGDICPPCTEIHAEIWRQEKRQQAQSTVQGDGG